jgi:hypothetical protein
MATSTSTRLHRTPSSASNKLKWTWSSWVKLATQTDNVTYWGQTFLCAYTDATNYTELGLQNSGLMDFVNVTGGSTNARLVTTRKFRDPSAWYHIVAVWDTANSTAGDRMKLYINGVEETSFGTDTNPSSSLNSIMNTTAPQEIGSRAGGSSYFNGAMAHTHFCDGYAYQASDFGETDSTSGIWVAKTSPSVSYGTNGYFLKYASGAAGTDSSGQTNNMTVAGTITSLKDNPDNNFCTLNPLDPNAYSSNQLQYTNVMNTVVPNGNNWKSTTSTMGNMTGKYYFETKIIGSDTNWWVGIIDPSQIQYVAGSKKITEYTRGYAITANGSKGNNGSEVAWGTTSIAQNDIICIAVDLTNSKIYARKNGDAWLESGDPTSGSTGTGSAYTLTQNGGNNISYVPAVSAYSTSAKLSCNFGAGYFGTTAVASAGTNASGVGTFEYDVPAGYTAFSTKGLNI